jgi:hypothetical protein
MTQGVAAQVNRAGPSTCCSCPCLDSSPFLLYSSHCASSRPEGVTARDDDADGPDDDEGQMGQTTINSSPTTCCLEIKRRRLSYKLHRDTIDEIPVSRLSPVPSTTCHLSGQITQDPAAARLIKHICSFLNLIGGWSFLLVRRVRNLPITSADRPTFSTEKINFTRRSSPIRLGIFRKKRVRSLVIVGCVP